MAQKKHGVTLKSFLKAQADNRVDYTNNIYTDEKGKQYNINDIEFTFHNFVQDNEIAELKTEVEALKTEIETLKSE